MSTPAQPDPWLRGPVAEIPALLQPIAHAFRAAREDIDRATAGLSPDKLWARPGDAASLDPAAGDFRRRLAVTRGHHYATPRSREPSEAPTARPRARQASDTVPSRQPMNSRSRRTKRRLLSGSIVITAQNCVPSIWRA